MKPAMPVRRGETQDRLLLCLRGAPGGLGVEALAQALGITLTAVRQHLVALERDGLVAKTSSPPTRGRPAHLYTLTAKMRESYPRQYPWFSELLLDSLRETLGEAGLKKKLRGLGRDAAGAKPSPSLPLAQRVEALAAKMTELGYEAAAAEGAAGPAVTAHNCVFHRLAERNPEVCSFDVGLIEQATGAAVTHEECMVRGGQVCRFALRASR